MYKHKQIGWLIIAIFLPIIVAFGFWVLFHPILYTGATALILLAVMLLFSSLTVEADNEKLYFYFGPGLFGKKIKYSNIQSAKKVRNPWYFGWGIHWFGRGWLYNVSGFDAVELTLRSGSALRVGTDEPDKLLNLISSKIAHSKMF